MKWLWIGLLVAGWTVLSMAQSFTVGRVEVVGNVSVPTNDILAAVPFEVGQEATRDDVLAAVQSILKLGYFAQVTPELAFDGDLVVVLFRVVEYPTIEDITFEGLPPAPRGKGTILSWLQEVLRGGNRPTEAKLREVLADAGVKVGEVLNQGRLEAALLGLAEEYRKLDWATVQIVPDLRGSELVLVVEELTVVGYRFEGLSTIPEEEAQQLVVVPVGEVGRISQIQESLAALGRSVFFSSAGVRAESGEGGVWLVWDVVERVILPQPSPVAGIDIQGVTAFHLDRLQELIGPLPEGLVTNYDVLRALGPIYDRYRREGFFMVELEGEGIEAGRLGVRMKEGRLARIEVGEGSRTAPWVIERVMDLSPGQLLTEGRFVVSRQALMALGYFQDVVLEPRWEDEELVLKVTVTDLAKLGSIGGNLAISPHDAGIVGDLTYSQKNVLGKAIDLSLSLKKGLTGSGSMTWSLSFSSHSFPVFDLVSIELYRRESGADPTTLSVGGGLRLAYPLAPYLDLAWGLASERAWELPEGEALDPRTSLEVGVTFDDRDSPLFPRTGSQGQVSLEKAGTFAPGVEYLLLKGELAGFSPADVGALLGDARAVLAGRALVRWGWDLPARYQFTLGGVDSVRGAQGVRTDRCGLLNGEFRVEIAQGSWIALFGDFGATWEGTVKSSLGVEIAANVAGMFVRLSLAWPNDRDPTWVPAFEFGMSPMF